MFLNLEDFQLPGFELAAIPDAFAISLSGLQGQIVDDLVARRLLIASMVFVIVALFNNPSYHWLLLSEDMQNNFANEEDAQSPPVSGGGTESGYVPAESCMYSYHLPSDVIWAPTPKDI
eukprot:XP_006577452.1 AT-hook motif nuclear-localized protein 17-like [Glycine max]